jgi:glutaredoxin
MSQARNTLVAIAPRSESMFSNSDFNIRQTTNEVYPKAVSHTDSVGSDTTAEFSGKGSFDDVEDEMEDLILSNNVVDSFDDVEDEMEELILSNNVVLIGSSACSRCDKVKSLLTSLDPHSRNHTIVDIDLDTDDNGKTMMSVLQQKTYGKIVIPVIFVRGQLQSLEDVEMMGKTGLLNKKLASGSLQSADGITLTEISKSKEADERYSSFEDALAVDTHHLCYGGEDGDDKFEDTVDPSSSSTEPKKKVGWKRLRQVRKKAARATGKHHFFKERVAMLKKRSNSNRNRESKSNTTPSSQEQTLTNMTRA